MGGTFRLMNMKFMRLAVLDDRNEDTPLTMRVPNLHEDEIQGDQVGAYLCYARISSPRDTVDNSTSRTRTV